MKVKVQFACLLSLEKNEEKEKDRIETGMSRLFKDESGERNGGGGDEKNTIKVSRSKILTSC